MNHVFLTVDLGFGDAGKGAVVDLLARRYEAHTVVRYSGGAQAGHRVVAPDGREHVFSQFGSGALAGAATHLSRFMLIEPLAMLEEARHLRALGAGEPFERASVDARALVMIGRSLQAVFPARRRFPAADARSARLSTRPDARPRPVGPGS